MEEFVKIRVGRKRKRGKMHTRVRVEEVASAFRVK